LIVVKLARPVLAAVVRLASRLIDPLVAPFWNRAALRRSR
jgi:hypothetical protein